MSITNCYCLQITEVYKVNRKAGTAVGVPRPWAALAFRVSGESHFCTNFTEITADSNSILYLPAGVAFSRESTDEELIIIHLICLPEDKMPLIEQNFDLEVLHPANPLQAFTYFSEIYKEWEAKNPGFRHLCTAKLHMLLASLGENTGHSSASDKLLLLQPGIDHLEAHFDDPSINIRQLAEKCHISEEYFRKLYKEAFGLSPHKAIMNKRIQKSCRLLQSGYFSVKEAAEQSGFQNQKYFSAHFHTVMEMTPSEYKKRNTGKGNML